MSSTFSATRARSNLYSLINQVNESHKPITLTSKNHNAILISEDDWSAIQETLYLLSIPGMRKSIKKGLETPINKCKKGIKW